MSEKIRRVFKQIRVRVNKQDFNKNNHVMIIYIINYYQNLTDLKIKTLFSILNYINLKMTNDHCINLLKVK